MKTFTEILKESKTDKYQHGYGPEYDKLFSQYRDESITICEIGVDKGYSARALRSYFNEADIHVFDNRFFPTIEGVNVHRLDQTDKQGQYEWLEENQVQPTIIIDDGGHKPEHHQKSLAPFFKALQSGGLYIIEDLQVCQEWFGRFGKYEVTPENNTITFLESLLTDAPIQSQYLTEEENQYIVDNLASCTLEVNNKLAILVKK